MVVKFLIKEISHVIKVRNEELIRAFGIRIRELRKSKGLTIEKLAELAGVDFRQVSYVEHGQVNPTLSMVYCLSKALDLPLSELLKITGY